MPLLHEIFCFLSSYSGGSNLPPEALPSIVETFWLPTTLFVPLSLLSLSLQGPAQPGHAHSGLSQMCLPLPTHPCIYNKLPPPPYLGAVVSFPFHFCFLFSFLWRGGGVHRR